MKVLVISDTHGNVHRAFAAHTKTEPVDAIIHLGDGSSDVDLLRKTLDIPIINVAGNCDPGSHAPRECVWECEGKRILLTHGDAYHVKSGLARLLQRAQEIGVDAVLFGHTHCAVAERHANVLFLNPGALANYGQHHGYAVLNITRENITCCLHDID
jgi:putative phosphoesterase